tara:strand:- start:1728 stop:2267 length:540 start_codon:yes stop_codon:yes gene_type:complete
VHNKFKISFLFGLIIFFNSTSVISQSDPAKALRMKMQGMYLYSFAKNVYWPSAYSTGDFTIGIYGSKDLFDQLSANFKGKMTGSQNIIFDFYETTSDISDCHMLFIGRQEASTISKVKKVLDKKTLLVTELKDISNSSSSIINLLYVNSRLKFQLNKSEAEKNNFKIGQTLTKLAYTPT